MTSCSYTAAMPRKASKASGPRPALGRHLMQLRQAAGLTQTELAELVGVPQVNIAFWEHSAKPPRSDVLEPMARALGVSVEKLLRPPTPAKTSERNSRGPRGHAQQLFAAVTKLPRRQQRRILDVLEALLAQASGGSAPDRAA